MAWVSINIQSLNVYKENHIEGFTFFADLFSKMCLLLYISIPIWISICLSFWLSCRRNNHSQCVIIKGSSHFCTWTINLQPLPVFDDMQTRQGRSLNNPSPRSASTRKTQRAICLYVQDGNKKGEMVSEWKRCERGREPKKLPPQPGNSGQPFQQISRAPRWRWVGRWLQYSFHRPILLEVMLYRLYL